MFTRSAQALAVLALVELGVFALAATVIDVLLLMLVLVALSVFGLFYLFRQASGLLRRTLIDTGSASTGGANMESKELGDGGLKLLGGALLVFPGLLTGLVGLLLLLPPVRAVVRPLAGARLSRLVPMEFSTSFVGVNRAFRRRDVVDVDAVQKDPKGSPPKPTAPPELR